jgi:hypothetical protein
VLEAPVPVLRHLRAAGGEVLEDLLDGLLVDHLAQSDTFGVLGGDVHGHVVVIDLDREVLANLAEHVLLLTLHDRPCPVVRIHHLVADLVQAQSPLRP